MRESRNQHSAQYDEEGNIILPEESETLSYVAQEEAPQASAAVQHEDLAQPCLSTRNRIISITNGTVRECISQYTCTFRDCEGACAYLARGLRILLRKTGGFLAQPVWVIIPNRKPRKYNRGTLFFMDVLRFGGTFAAIFVVLFATLNYRSFWEIMQEKVQPLQHAQHVQQQQAIVDATLRDKLLRSPSLTTAGKEAGDMLSYLPPIGPPENRIIIPKLGLNVPLVTPSYQSLLDEDWEKVEADIQDALQMGIVHYPGTARPGQAGNFFVTGHSSYYPWAPGKYKSVFARLHNLEAGDEYYVYYGGDQHRYIVRSKKEVSPSNVDVLDQPVNRRLATLMTCTPVGTTLHRLILVAEEVDPLTGEVLAVGEQQQRENLQRPEMLPI